MFRLILSSLETQTQKKLKHKDPKNTKCSLVDYKMMISYIRYAILAIFIVAAALTPPDMISQFLLAIPLLLLYALSIGVAWAFRLEPEVKAAAATPDNTGII